jgi:hypothetical protein
LKLPLLLLSSCTKLFTVVYQRLLFNLWMTKFTITQKKHLALGNLAKLVFWLILSFKNWKHLGAEFVLPFFSCSQDVIKKSSNYTLFHSKWGLRTKLCHFSDNFIIWNIKVVIWWLFDNDLRTREREPEEKNSAP